jgi:NAD(P)-dependent dehydrogenase (short-subunit alcohol dehydrogenase family)
MLEGVFERTAQEHGVEPQDMQTRYTALIPMDRIGRPEEAAEAAVWLCSPAASYITGHSLIADGGI